MKSFQQNFFFCISFLIIFSSLSFPQGIDKKKVGDNAYNKAWTPYFLDTNYTQSANTMQFIGDATKSKVSKDSGGTRFVDYTKVWREDIEYISNGTFDSNIYGWRKFNDPVATMEWVASGGGFTGAMHVVLNANLRGIADSFYVANRLIAPQGTYRLRYDINIVANNLETGIDGVYVLAMPLKYNKTYTGTGSFSVDTILVINTDNRYLGFGVLQRGLGDCEFYLDNVSIEVEFNEDSVRGKTYNLPINVFNDDSWHYWQYYGFWKQKDKDTVWVYSDIDSVFTPGYYDCQPTSINFTNITNASLDSQYVSNSVVITGITCDSVEAYSSGDYRIGALGSWNTTDTFYVSLNDTIWTRMLSASEYEETDTLTFTIYSPTTITDIWTLTTGLPAPPVRVIISDNGGDNTHRANTKQAFIDGYECIGGTWTDSIWVYNADLASAFAYTDSLSTEIVVRSTTGLTSYIALAESYTPDVMTFIPSGSNSHTQVYNSGGTLPDLIVTGAGDAANETGYDVEFFSPDPITGEPDLSSYSNGYIAGVMMFLADTLNVTLWQVRDTLRARLGGSWTTEDGYGLVNCDLVNTIVNGSTPDGYLVNQDGGKILMKGRTYAIKFK